MLVETALRYSLAASLAYLPSERLASGRSDYAQRLSPQLQFAEQVGGSRSVEAPSPPLFNPLPSTHPVGGREEGRQFGQVWRWVLRRQVACASERGQQGVDHFAGPRCLRARWQVRRGLTPRLQSSKTDVLDVFCDNINEMGMVLLTIESIGRRAGMWRAVVAGTRCA